MDEAAAHVNARPAKRPDEIVETMKRIKFIAQRMENAIQNHEFEKARFYSDEEKKERANLSALCKKHNIGEPGVDPVTRGDVEEVLSRWTGIPVTTIRQSEPEVGPQDSPEE
jgi:ATP-dependent Clp protease ATP-binding subunit ClpC